jgi:hypothetical protein
MQRGLPDSSSCVATTTNTASSSGLTSMAEVSSINDAPARPSKVQKGVKRKADTTTSFDEEGPKSVVDKKRDVRPIKRPAPALIDYASLKPRFKGKLTNQMKYCQRIMTELLGKKCKVIKKIFAISKR